MTGPDQPLVCVVPAAKIVSYLLDPTHPRGGAKARFFMSFGYTKANPERLATDLLAHPHPAHFAAEAHTPDGQRKLVFEGEIKAPDGQRPHIRTVWRIDDAGEAVFVTAVPLRGRMGGPQAAS